MLFESAVLFESAFTSGGSELGEGRERIEQLAKGAAVLRGKRFRASASESRGRRFQIISWKKKEHVTRAEHDRKNRGLSTENSS